MPYHNFNRYFVLKSGLFFNSQQPICAYVQSCRDQLYCIGGRLNGSVEIFMNALTSDTRQLLDLSGIKPTLAHELLQPSRKGKIHFLMSGDM